MRILVIASFFPYPAHFGGAFDVLERIKEIRSLGHDIDLICTCKEFPDKKNIDFIKQFVNELIIVPRKNRIIDLFLKKPLQVVSRKTLKHISLKKVYDYAVLESEYVGMILENETFKANRIILRVHNNESNYFYQLSESAQKYADKIYYYLEAVKLKSYSKIIKNKADRLWFISNKEVSNEPLFKEKSIHLPTSINDIFVQQELSNKNVLFIGALFMPNNLEAIVWYLKNVHVSLIENRNYKLIIAGSTGNFEPDFFLKIFKDYSNVEVRLNQKDLSSCYAEATIFINPMLHGAGVKLKSINAIRNGLILISSEIGIEGTGFVKNEMYLKADSPADFSNAILKVFDMDIARKQEIVKRAQDFLSNSNSLSTLKKEFQNEKE